MEETESFEALVRQKLINHEFNPICIEASVKKANVKKGGQRYEKTEKATSNTENGARLKEASNVNETEEKSTGTRTRIIWNTANENGPIAGNAIERKE